jgi:microcystin degradation protein MlrC
MPKRVLLAGLFHETHTFLDGKTTLDDFRIRRGAELLDAERDGSPLSGAIEVARSANWDLQPTIDLRATPSGTVDDAVVELFWDEFLATAEEQQHIDGIFLVLHGAMATETLRDVEGEIIVRMRAIRCLANVPICGVLDLHGNISSRTITPTQGFVAYRCNPHVDACATSQEAALFLDQIMTSGKRPVSIWERIPVMWPPTGTGTDDDPMRRLESMARAIERDDPEIAFVNVFAGFSFADTPDIGVSFSAVTYGAPEAARRKLGMLCEWAFDHRQRGNVVDPPLADVMPGIAEEARQAVGPVVIVEPADNIGGGAPGDGTSILRALIEYNVENGAVVLNDPDAVALLQEKSIGETFRIALGGRGSRLGDGPLELDVELLSTSDGRFDLEDRNSHLASMSGVHIDMGPSAVVKHRGTRILLTSRKTPPFDLGQLRSQGIEPEGLSVIGVKAAVAHRRAYEPIQSASYTVATPGPCASDLKSFPFQHVRRPIFPLDEL